MIVRKIVSIYKWKLSDILKFSGIVSSLWVINIKRLLLCKRERGSESQSSMLLSPPIHINVYVVHLLIASLIFLFFSSQKFLWNFYMEVFLLAHFLTASKIITYANTYLISALLSLAVLRPWSCCVVLAYVIGGPLAKGTRLPGSYLS